ncbi:MAG: DUF4340 domain-containing protein [Leptolyngbyaceae cyanobacterium bins.302]|nr:DUF4340 domain-containing protein [Leptolyngbyaceae cyanobacterium bins.302]
MKLQRTPMILITIAALLGGVVFLVELQKNPTQEETQSADKKLFPFQESDIQAFTLQTPVFRRSFVKVPTSQPSAKAGSQTPSPVPQIWQMTAPEKAIASEGSIAFLLNLIGTGTSEKTLTIPVSRLAEFGLDQPQATIDITLSNQKKHRLVLGDPDFNRSFLYAQVDPPAKPESDQTIHLVSLDFENAVNRPISEWKQQAADKPTLPQPPTPNPQPPK